ncbi:MAG TPA: zf-HC2 domain-containing protein [Polyangiales bacterium]
MAIDHRVRCDEIVELVSDYLDGDLTASEREVLEQHVLICSGCAEYVAQVRTIVKQAERLTTSDEVEDAQLAPLLAQFRRQKPGDQER